MHTVALLCSSRTVQVGGTKDSIWNIKCIVTMCPYLAKYAISCRMHVIRIRCHGMSQNISRHSDGKGSVSVNVDACADNVYQALLSAYEREPGFEATTAASHDHKISTVYSNRVAHFS